MSMLLPLPFVPQLRDGYCLPACVTMVLTYWGVQIISRGSHSYSELQMLAHRFHEFNA